MHVVMLEITYKNIYMSLTNVRKLTFDIHGRNSTAWHATCSKCAEGYTRCRAID